MGTTRQAPVSVVVATRNRRRRLLRTLESLTTLPERPPVVVVDNASHDGTSSAVRSAFPQVRLLSLSDNRGAAARNLGVRIVDTPYVAFADDDSWWATDSLEAAAVCFDRHPRLALALARIVVEPAGEVDPACRKAALSPLGRPVDLPGPSILGHLACGTVVRREAFLSVGGYSTMLHFGGEEQLLSLDLAVRGWGQSYVDDLVSYHHPASEREPWGERWARYRRNDTLVCWLRRPLAVAFGETVRLVAEAIREPVVRAPLAELIGLLPAALAARRRLPAAVERQLRQLTTAD